MNEIDKKELDAYIEQENPAYSDSKEYYYPYCGYELGFCLKGSPCDLAYGNHKGCQYWVAKHPLTNKRPQNIYSVDGLRMVEVKEAIMEEDDTD